MKFHELNTKPKKDRKRKGRGVAAGQGKTAGRGTKGQKSRSGGSVRSGFEGGQNPLLFRLPKLRGFKSHRKPVQTVTTGQLEALGEKEITNEVLANSGAVASKFDAVKVVVKGELKSAVNVKLQAASETAQVAIQKAGGSFEVVAVPTKPKKVNKTK